jgi:hypothetical protein
MNGSTVALVVMSWIWTRWLTLGGGEVDGMDEKHGGAG